MKVVILGASGMLGSMLVKVLSQSFDIVATVRNKDFIKSTPGVSWRIFDALKTNGTYLAKILKGADWAINAIGIIPQRYGQQEAGKIFFQTNGWFPHRLGQVAQSESVRAIQVTTDCVFNGETGNYTETSPPDPFVNDSAYALSKSQGDKAEGLCYLRCSIVGPEYHGKSLLGWFLSQPKGATVDGYTNHFWNGVTTLVFAKVCQGIIDNKLDLPHCQHLVPADSVSKAGLLGYFREYFDRQDITINAVPAPNGKRDMTLATVNPDLNSRLWELAGYAEIPTIRELVRELAEYVK